LTKTATTAAFFLFCYKTDKTCIAEPVAGSENGVNLDVFLSLNLRIPERFQPLNQGAAAAESAAYAAVGDYAGGSESDNRDAYLEKAS
jgi:hypothetical protein